MLGEEGQGGQQNTRGARMPCRLLQNISAAAEHPLAALHNQWLSVCAVLMLDV